MKDSFHVARILSDRYPVCGMFYRYPSRYRRFLAEKIYEDVFESSIECYTDSALMVWMIHSGLWSQQEEDRLEGLKKDLEELKVQLFQAYLNTSHQKLIRKKLLECKHLIQELTVKKHSHDHLTSEYVAAKARDRFLIGCGLFSKGWYWKNPLDDWVKPDEIVERASAEINRVVLDESQIRSLSKSVEWRSFWNLKSKVVPECTINMNEELRSLILWSTMYDSIGKHPECPSQDVIEDDDMIDGWMVLQRRKNEKSSIEREKQTLLQRHGACGEIFVVSDRPDYVMEMNNREGRDIIKQRRQVIESKGKAVDTDFYDVGVELNQKRGM